MMKDLRPPSESLSLISDVKNVLLSHVILIVFVLLFNNFNQRASSVQVQSIAE
jgi:hypothetical protein